MQREAAERIEVGYDHLEQEVHLAGHRVRRDDFRPLLQRAAKTLDHVVGMALELDLDVGQHVLPDALGIEDRRIAADDSLLFEPPHAPRAGRGRQPDPLGEIDVAQAPVALQQLEDADVGAIQRRHGGLTHGTRDI